MKQKILFILLTLGFTSAIFAQGWGREWMREGTHFPAAETVTVSGSLTVAYGAPALKNGDVTYLVRGINRLAGFVDGLKAGADVTIEGSAWTSPQDANIRILRTAKLTLNGETYDLAPLPPPAVSRAPAPSFPLSRQSHHRFDNHRFNNHRGYRYWDR